MHKYQPRIHLVKRNEGSSGSVVDLENEEYKTFIFPETIFTAVTAYQNQLVSIMSSIPKVDFRYLVTVLNFDRLISHLKKSSQKYL